MSAMDDVYLMQHGGVALWIIAVSAVLIVLLLWLITVRVSEIARVVAPASMRTAAALEAAKGPSQPEG